MLPRPLLLLSVVAAAAHAIDNNVVTVPKDLMRFILGCQRVSPTAEGAVPVYSVDIDEKEGTTSQSFGMLNMGELGHALRQTVDNEAVVQRIMAQVEDAVSSSSRGRGKCNVENKINIDIPPQEVSHFGDRMQQVTQQNNFLLLEQINNLINLKLRQQSDGTERMLKRKLKQINDKLNLVLQALGKEVIPDDDDNDDDDNDDDDNDDDDDDDNATDVPGAATGEDTESGSTDSAASEASPDITPDCKCKNKTHTDKDSSEDTTEPQPAPEQEQTTAQPEPEPEPEPVSEDVSGEAPGSASGEIATTMAAPVNAAGLESEEQPEPEPQAEPSTTIIPPTLPPTAKPTARPVPVVLTTQKIFPDSGSDENSSVSDDDDDDSSSSEPSVGFERVAQQPVGVYNSMALLRPLMRRPPLLLNNPQTSLHRRERVPLA